jgi:hypothetical protein
MENTKHNPKINGMDRSNFQNVIKKKAIPITDRAGL